MVSSRLGPDSCRQWLHHGAWMRPEQRPSGHQLVTQNYLGWRPRVVARPAFLETDELLSVLYLRELLVLSWFYYFVWWEFSEFFNQVLFIWSVIISLCKSCFINIQLWWGRVLYLTQSTLGTRIGGTCDLSAVVRHLVVNTHSISLFLDLTLDYS